MISTIIWNIRGVESKGAFDRLIKLVNFYKVSFVALLEPFVHSSNLEQYKRKLGFQHTIANCNGKIWCFWDADYTCTVISNYKQQLTLSVQHAMVQDTYWVTIVYAKTKARRKKKLWQKLEQIKDIIQGPWSMFGDFNSIMQAIEKKGGRPHRIRKSKDFINYMDDYCMIDAGYIGNDFTWSNNRKRRKRISERLDRVLYNDE
ncbi:uncharacterized protein LOC107816829 [Nicotiana tabacum]|uniref:Uncharacterized protein LOC107816829 n=1 Tax=Nicotiana tabacum TaxID=4097 RepID=A0A1S4C9Y5_TOBAC|nr:PREDICTED: uncharacterized protein LOC107816829 [Nicotiana tabacum]